ncbi:MAG: PAS domain-containing protein [Armatimonadota bacterium]
MSIPRSRGTASPVVSSDLRSSFPFVSEGNVDQALTVLKPLVEAVGATVGPHCEVVLHDSRAPEKSIVAIWNGAVTGRRVGGPVVGGPKEDVALKLLDSAVTKSTLYSGPGTASL